MLAPDLRNKITEMRNAVIKLKIIQSLLHYDQGVKRQVLLGGGVIYFTIFFGRGVQQTVRKVTQQDLITTKNEGSMGYKVLKRKVCA